MADSEDDREETGPAPTSSHGAAPPAGSAPSNRRRRRGIDVVVVAGLTLLAGFMRARARPIDGLWFDDAWVATGAKAPLSDLLAVSTNHPGFTLGLMSVHRVVTERAELLVIPGLLLAVATPGLLYLVVRRMRIPAAISVLPAALVALSWAHAVYSGRVKPYVIEVAAIVVIVALVQLLERRTWRWTTGLVWGAAMVAVASLGAFASVAAGAATLVLAIAGDEDRRVRWATLVVQGAAQLALVLVTRRRYDATTVAEDWSTVYDGYIDLSGGPVEGVEDVGRHIARLGEAWIDSGPVLGLIVVGVALFGLAAHAWRGDRSAPARFLLLLVVVAAVGSVFEQVPFGADPTRGAFPGSRASLWLLPSLAVGLALALDAVRARLARMDPRAGTALSVAAVLGTVALVGVGVDDRPVHVDLGTRTATQAIEAHRTGATVVLVFPANDFSVSSEPPIRVRIVPDPDHLNGFRAVPLTGREIVPPGPALTPEAIRDLVRGAERVIVHTTFAAFGVVAAWDKVVAELEALGFQRVEASTAAFNTWERWERSGG